MIEESLGLAFFVSAQCLREADKFIKSALQLATHGSMVTKIVATDIAATQIGMSLPQSQRVAVVDFDIPFGSVLKIMFKWMAATFIVACCFAPVIILVWVIVMAMVAAFLGGAMSSMHH